MLKLHKIIRLPAKVIVVVVLVTALLTISLVTQISSQVEASASMATMSLFIKQLHAEGKQILFQFAIPLVADQTLWIIPDIIENDGDDVSRFISSIGDDYICFDELAGQANSIRCTLFSNIVSISYIDQPS